MKLTLNTTKLLSALHMLNKVISNKTTIPILKNILIEPNIDNINIIGTDNMSIFIRVSVECICDGEEKICIPVKYLYDFISFTKESQIYIETTNEINIKVYTEKSYININGMDPQEYPSFPEIKKGNAIKMSGQYIAQCLDNTIFSASKDLSRIKFTGINMNIQNQELIFAATDSYRLSECRIGLDKDKFKDISVKVILPANTASIIQSISDGYNDIDFYIDEKQISLIAGNIYLISLLIDGSYPNYQSIIPVDYKTKIVLDKLTFLSEIRKSMIFEGIVNNLVSMEYLDNNISISSIAEARGKMESNISIKGEGESIKISFNAQYMIDVISKIKSENISIEMNGTIGPIVFRQKLDDISTLFLIMPLRS